jgi:hypothetical protein
MQLFWPCVTGSIELGWDHLAASQVHTVLLLPSVRAEASTSIKWGWYVHAVWNDTFLESLSNFMLQKCLYSIKIDFHALYAVGHYYIFYWLYFINSRSQVGGLLWKWMVVFLIVMFVTVLSGLSNHKISAWCKLKVKNDGNYIQGINHSWVISRRNYHAVLQCIFATVFLLSFQYLHQTSLAYRLLQAVSFRYTT